MRTVSDHLHEKGQRDAKRSQERELEETKACKKEQLFTVHINLGDVSSQPHTRISFLCDLLPCTGRGSSALGSAQPAQHSFL